MKKHRVNKERDGLTVRFSVRLPKEQHAWLKARSETVRTKDGKRISMNKIISEALEEYMIN